jgi:hypothetical protein
VIRASLLAIAMLAITAAGASAQGRFEISGGVTASGGVDFGKRNAELTSNVPNGSPTVLFTTESSIESTVGVHARLGVDLTSSFAIEGGFHFSRPVYRIRASGDFEQAPNVTADETFNDYVVDGSAVWHFGDARHRRAVPFVFGGAGYVRALHDGAASLEDGVEYHAGGGIKWWLGSGAGHFGIRADAGVSIRDREFDLESKSRVTPLVTASAVWRF